MTENKKQKFAHGAEYIVPTEPGLNPVQYNLERYRHLPEKSEKQSNTES